MAGDSFMPPDPPRVSFMRRLNWRPTRIPGGWYTDILDTTKPESMSIVPDQDSDNPPGVFLVIFRNLEFGVSRRLGRFPDADAAKEFARKMVGDLE